MAIVTTYVCDVSGKSGVDKKDFIPVTITADNSNIDGLSYAKRQVRLDKLIHVDVARKLHLVNLNSGEEASPEPTLESKLSTLLKDYIYDIAYEAGCDAVANRN